jgi:predicted kinase
VKQAQLILFSGLPGSGKTTLARRLAQQLHIPVLAKDRIQAALRAHGLAGRATADGYHLMLELADEQLALGISVILEAVFPLAGFRVSAQELAQRHSAGFRAIYCYCSDEGVWQKRMQVRQPLVPHWTPVGWDDVERLRASFQPWDPQEALFIDSLNDLEENLALVLKWVQQVKCKM